MPRVTALYAALLALLFLALSFAVIRQRYRTRIAIGTGREPALERAARVHANFAEYAPFALLLMLLAELLGAAPWWLHAIGLALLVGRAVHAFGVSQREENLRFRQAGMALTFAVLALGAATAAWLSLTR
ncbi:MAG TPA: MAPEG family protein [Acetobacteraceae bacterium]|nr:MAPEG family protein [Acetobacteraceae bacterium]